MLAQRFSVKAWTGTDIDDERQPNYNRIVNQHFMEYYCKYWKDRHEKLHDKVTQRKRVIEWQKNEHCKAIEGNHPQVRKYAIENEINAENCTTEHIRRWVYVLREIRKRAENIKKATFGVILN